MDLRKARTVLLGVLLVSGLSLSGCGGNSTLDAIEKLKDEVCACKTKKCAKKVFKKGKKLEKKAKKMGNVEKAKALGFFKEGQACMKKLKK